MNQKYKIGDIFEDKYGNIAMICAIYKKNDKFEYWFVGQENGVSEKSLTQNFSLIKNQKFENQLKTNEEEYYDIDNFCFMTCGLGNYSKNCFQTHKDAEQYQKYLIAKRILIADTKGFVPDWSNDEEIKYYVIYSEYLGEKQFEIKGYTYTNINWRTTYE